VPGTPLRFGPAGRRVLAAVLFIAGTDAAMGSTPVTSQHAQPPTPQNPSPMVEHTRAHERLPERAPEGRRITVTAAGLSRPAQVFVPGSLAPGAPLRLLIHFHGAAFVAEHAAARAASPYAVAVVNLGAGSGAYERAFTTPAAFDSLLVAVETGVRAVLGTGVAPDRLVLSAFSAGHGAIRAILREPTHAGRVSGALLLDGIHAGYQPAGAVLAQGGALDTAVLAPILELARRAAQGDVAVLVTHSEIFPGTFASTTETTDYIAGALGSRRRPVLAWGPVGMQQLSEVRLGRLAILGFAGNAAPDHIDHLHGMPDFLQQLDTLLDSEGERPALRR
jgi:hypothetical protein